MTLPPLTLINVLAAVLALLGGLFVFNGFRHAVLGDTIVGAILLLVVWAVLTL